MLMPVINNKLQMFVVIEHCLEFTLQTPKTILCPVKYSLVVFFVLDSSLQSFWFITSEAK